MKDGSFLFPSVSFPFQIPILLGGWLFQSPLMGSPSVRGDRDPIQAHDCHHSMENGVVGNGADPGPLSMASLLGLSQPVPPLVIHPNDFHAPSEEGLQEILLPSHTCSWTKETLWLSEASPPGHTPVPSGSHHTERRAQQTFLFQLS